MICLTIAWCTPVIKEALSMQTPIQYLQSNLFWWSNHQGFTLYYLQLFSLEVLCIKVDLHEDHCPCSIRQKLKWYCSICSIFSRLVQLYGIVWACLYSLHKLTFNVITHVNNSSGNSVIGQWYWPNFVVAASACNSRHISSALSKISSSAIVKAFLLWATQAATKMAFYWVVKTLCCA